MRNNPRKQGFSLSFFRISDGFGAGDICVLIMKTL